MGEGQGLAVELTVTTAEQPEVAGGVRSGEYSFSGAILAPTSFLMPGDSGAGARVVSKAAAGALRCLLKGARIPSKADFAFMATCKKHILSASARRGFDVCRRNLLFVLHEMCQYLEC